MADRKKSVGRILLAVGGVWFGLTILANAGLLGSGALAAFFSGVVFLPIIALFLGRAMIRARGPSLIRPTTAAPSARKTPPAIPGRASSPPAPPVPARPRPPSRPADRPIEKPASRASDEAVPTTSAYSAEPKPASVLEPEMLPALGEAPKKTSAEMIEEAKRRYSSRD